MRLRVKNFRNAGKFGSASITRTSPCPCFRNIKTQGCWCPGTHFAEGMSTRYGALSRRMAPRQYSRSRRSYRPRYPSTRLNLSQFGRLTASRSVPRNPRYNCAIPPQLNVCLKYVTRILLNPTSGTADNYQFRMNSLFDPDLTGTGHQPAGYDQIATLYNRWLVTKCSIQVTAWPAQTFPLVDTQQSSAIVCLNKTRDQMTFTNIETAMEQDYSKYCNIGINGGPKTVRDTTDIADFAGIDARSMLNNEYYTGAIGANPAYVPVYTITAQCPVSGVNGEPFGLSVIIWYQTTFFNPDSTLTS